MRQPGWSDKFYTWAYITPMMRLNKTAALRLHTKFVAVGELPSEVQLRRFANLRSETDEVAAKKPWLAPSMMLARSFFPRAFAGHCRTQVALRCGAVASALEQFRRAHGHWPESLEELVPAYLREIPKDPFDGRPLRLNRLVDGLVIYSVGPDGEDNGGTFDQERWDRQGSDVGLRVLDVGKRRQPAVVRPSD
jgi:hypothetical protein